MGTLFWRLDRRLTNCPAPQLLPSHHRLRGCAIIEKAKTNIHCHILIDCENVLEQVFTALRLFEALDTSPDRRWDHAWQEDAWRTLIDRNWIKDADRTRTVSPFLKNVMPAGTAAVQLVRTKEDRLRVCEYMTKELGTATTALTRVSDYWAACADLDFKFLQEWHQEISSAKLASNIRIDPASGSKVLNLDDQSPWKSRGRRLHF